MTSYDCLVVAVTFDDHDGDDDSAYDDDDDDDRDDNDNDDYDDHSASDDDHDNDNNNQYDWWSLPDSDDDGEGVWWVLQKKIEHLEGGRQLRASTAGVQRTKEEEQAREKVRTYTWSN